MNNWSRATAVLLEPQLVCACGAMNDPHFRQIKIDEHSICACDACGASGPVQDFLPKEKR